jgi:hypothetical protein
MTLPLFKVLREGPPLPRVVLLPDGLFFTRSIAIGTASTLADVTAQVELALETLSPFPPTQLYHGFFWPQGAERAFVFAAYRRRFTNEQLAGWESAELVMPSFAALFGGDVKADTTLIVASSEGLTAIYWDQSPVPAKLVFHPMPGEATEADWDRAREQLTASAPNNRQIVLGSPPIVASSPTDRDLIFKSDAFTSRIPATQASALDVRDKESLAALRSSRRRDLMLWRGFVGLLATLLILIVAEFALAGIGMWHKARLAKVNEQRPIVEKIMVAQSVTTRINDLSTKRLLPIEMIHLAITALPRTPTGEPTVQFMRASTVELHGLNVEAKSSSPGAPSAYQAALSALPAVEKVEVRDLRARDNEITFTLAVTFRPETVKPTPATP